jgi:hypothetical protein
MDLERRDRCRELVYTARSMCSARAQSEKHWLVPGAGSEPLGYYGPSAGLRSSPTKSIAPGGLAFGSQCAAFRGIGECQLCGPKPLRFLMRLHAEHPTPHPLKHAGVEPGRKQSLHFPLAIKCRREPHHPLRHPCAGRDPASFNPKLGARLRGHDDLVFSPCLALSWASTVLLARTLDGRAMLFWPSHGESM